jgi:hypothetical protein
MSWQEEFQNDPIKQEHFKIALAYYANNKFFHKEIIELSKADGFIPTEEQFNKVVKNKFAQRVINAALQAPKFENGTIVSVLTPKEFHWHNGTRTPPKKIIGVIVQVNSSIPQNAVHGAKRYKVLPFGMLYPIEAEERFMKKVRKKDFNK